LACTLGIGFPSVCHYTGPVFPKQGIFLPDATNSQILLSAMHSVIERDVGTACGGYLRSRLWRAGWDDPDIHLPLPSQSDASNETGTEVTPSHG